MTRERKILVGSGLVAVLSLLGWSGYSEQQLAAVSAERARVDEPSVMTGPRGAAGPSLPITATIMGRVELAGAGPLPPARVCLLPAELVMANTASGWQPERERCVDVEAGRYRLAGLGTGRYVVAVTAEGFLPVQHQEAPMRPWISLRSGEQREGVDFVLRLRGVPLRGVVRDVAGGTISGAVVYEGDGGRATTGEDGEFTLWVEPQRTVVLAAWAPGYTAESAFARPPQAPMSVYLAPESVLRGRVLRAAGGEALAGQPVHLRDEQTIDAETGAAGEFEIRGLAPGRHKPYVRSGGWCGSAAAPVALGLGETSAQIEISARPCRTVAAHVRVRGSEAGCGSAQIELLDAVGDVVRRALADPSGDAALSGVEAGDYRVRIACPGHVQREPTAWLLGERMQTEVTWEVEPGRTLRGEVVDARGARVPRANIEVVGPYGYVTAYAGDDGEFVVTGVAPGRNKIQPYHSTHLNGEPLELEVRETEDPRPLRLEFLPSASLSGRVRARVGELPGGLTVVARALENFGAGSVRLDAEGRYRMDGLQKMPYRVAVQRAGGVVEPERAGELAPPVIVDLGEVDAGVADFVLDVPGPGTLIGRVENADGSGEPDALVTVRESLGRQSQRLLTDDAGRFTVPVELGATYTVEVTARDGGTLLLRDVAPDRALVLRFAATRRVCGVVRAELPVTGDFTIETDLGVRESFASGERWCLDRVPLGVRTLSARSPRLGTATARIEVPAAGAVPEVTLGFAGRTVLRGRVVDGSGQPRADLRVWVLDATGRLVGGTLHTDASGEFVLEGAPAGELTVIPIAAGPWPSREQMLALGTKVTISAEIPPAPLLLTMP